MKTRVSVKYSTTRDVVSDVLRIHRGTFVGKMPGITRLPHTKASLPRDGHAKELLVENVKQ